MSKEKKKVSFAYGEMLHMSHHVSGKHPQMSRYDRYLFLPRCEKIRWKICNRNGKDPEAGHLPAHDSAG